MGVDNFQYGHDTVGYFIPESTAFSPEKATAASAFRATSITLGQAVGREFPDDYKGTRSRVERITGRTPVQPWSASGILRLSGSAGTAPEIGDILKHAFGTETVNGSTSVDARSPVTSATALRIAAISTGSTRLRSSSGR